MPCQWSVMTTLFSTTQFTKKPSKQPIACMVLRSGWFGFTCVDEDVAAQDDAADLARAHAARAHRPALEAVVVVACPAGRST